MVLHREIDADYLRRLNALIRRVDEAVALSRIHGEPGKIYDGEWEIALTVSPSDENWIECVIKLHCYLIGPARHYEWKGESIAEALDNCEKDVYAWCDEVFDEYRKE